MNYYRVLGVEVDADAATIKKAYRELAQKYHPDRNSGDKSAEAKMKKINEAYGVLGDEKKRRVYDKTQKEETEQRDPTIDEDWLITQIQMGNFPMDLLIQISRSKNFSNKVREHAGFCINQTLGDLGMIEELFTYISDKKIPETVRRDGWNRIDRMICSIERDDDLLLRMSMDPHCSKTVKSKRLEKAVGRLIETLHKDNKVRELLIICVSEEIPEHLRERAGWRAISLLGIRESAILLEVAQNSQMPQSVRERAREKIGEIITTQVTRIKTEREPESKPTSKIRR
jgi:curved DNA-binding protein CbpA